MPLVSGTKLGPYEIVEPLGAGGMGEVYRGRDTRLGRDVALKVLLEAFARDADRMVRFEREAKVLASLNHPNIASIYGLEESNGTRALVMELVEGPTLAERLKQEGIPLEEALPIAKQICEGLEYAHERGVIHRDLKPANVKISSDGAVKLLDFGLAKALESDVTGSDISSSPTISRLATQAGIILGTAAYMSPEQAKGKAIDRRTDIWAFGCVLYEMLTGKPAFGGETVSDTIGKILEREPAWSALPPATPASVRRLLHRCLQKDVKRRQRDIGDARLEIEDDISLAVAPTARDSADISTVRPARRSKFWIVSAAVLLMLLVGTIAEFVFFYRSLEAPHPVKFFVGPPEKGAFSGTSLDFITRANISPDGRRLAF